jgi:hypothetical protein
MRFNTHALRVAGAMAALGTILAIPVAHFMPDRYVSLAAITAISTSPNPLTPDQLQGRISLLRSDLLNRSTPSEIVQGLDLYKPQRYLLPMDEITKQMRADIDVWGVFYPDHKRVAL